MEMIYTKMLLFFLSLVHTCSAEVDNKDEILKVTSILCFTFGTILWVALCLLKKGTVEELPKIENGSPEIKLIETEVSVSLIPNTEAINQQKREGEHKGVVLVTKEDDPSSKNVILDNMESSIEDKRDERREEITEHKVVIIKEVSLEDLDKDEVKDKHNEANKNKEEVTGNSIISSPTKRDPFKKMEQLLTESDLKLAAALCKFAYSHEGDKVAEALVIIMELNGKTVDLIDRLLAKEVKEASQAGSLLRSNSMASKVMKYYSSLIGTDFLRTLLGPLIQEICDEKEDCFEMDPSLISPEQLEKNKKKLIESCDKFLRTIIESIDNTPIQFRMICNLLRTRVASKFPGSAQVCIGGFIFLRFFCVAIFTPMYCGITKATPPEMAQKGLTLIAKTLQNMANNLTFEMKDERLDWLNDYITRHFSTCQDYFDRLATVPSVPKEPVVVEVSKERKETALELLLSTSKALRNALQEKYQGKPFYGKLTNILFLYEVELAKRKALERTTSMDSLPNHRNSTLLASFHSLRKKLSITPRVSKLLSDHNSA